MTDPESYGPGNPEEFGDWVERRGSLGDPDDDRDQRRRDYFENAGQPIYDPVTGRLQGYEDLLPFQTFPEQTGNPYGSFDETAAVLPPIPYRDQEGNPVKQAEREGPTEHLGPTSAQPKGLTWGSEERVLADLRTIICQLPGSGGLGRQDPDSTPLTYAGQSVDVARLLVFKQTGSHELHTQRLFPEPLEPQRIEHYQALSHWANELRLPPYEVEIAPLAAFHEFVAHQQEDEQFDWKRYVAALESAQGNPGWLERLGRMIGLREPDDDFQIAVQAQRLTSKKTLQGLVFTLKLPTWGDHPDRPLEPPRTFQIPIQPLVRSLNRLAGAQYRIYLESFSPQTLLTDPLLVKCLGRLSDALSAIESENVANRARRSGLKAIERAIDCAVEHQGRDQILGRVHWAIQEYGVEIVA